MCGQLPEGLKVPVKHLFQGRASVVKTQANQFLIHDFPISTDLLDCNPSTKLPLIHGHGGILESV